MHGKGNYHWSNGDKYEGDWKENMMNGKGKKTYANGAFYDGTWLNGKMILSKVELFYIVLALIQFIISR